jgi:hypothetical protein
MVALTESTLTLRSRVLHITIRYEGVPLPTDRVYDGLDLTDLLTGKTQSAHTWLFHPNSGASGVNGWLDAVRYMQYKAIYQTGGAPGCSDHGAGRPTPGATKIHRNGGTDDPPLLFDLEKDPAGAWLLDFHSPHPFSRCSAPHNAY